VNAKKHIPRRELEKLYLEEKKTIYEIAEIFGVGKSTVYRRLKEYNIPIRPLGESFSHTLKGRRKSREHVEKIAKKLRKFNPPPEEIADLYINEGLSQSEIAEIYGVSQATVSRYMKKHGIPVRNFVQASLKGRLKVLSGKKPSSLERTLINIVKKYNIPLTYSGDGKFMIGGKAPDFVNFRKMLVVEVFGSAFHDPQKSFKKVPYHQTEEGTKEHYRKFGFDCLVLWDYELKDEKKVVSKLTRFINSKK